MYAVHIKCKDVIWRRHANQLLLVAPFQHETVEQNIERNNNVDINIEGNANTPFTQPIFETNQNMENQCTTTSNELVTTNEIINEADPPPLRRSSRIRKPPIRYPNG